MSAHPGWTPMVYDDPKPLTPDDLKKALFAEAPGVPFYVVSQAEYDWLKGFYAKRAKK